MLIDPIFGGAWSDLVPSPPYNTAAEVALKIEIARIKSTQSPKISITKNGIEIRRLRNQDEL